MPERGWSLPALLACETGSSLARKDGTVCSKCYACKGRYQETVVAASLRARWDRLQAAMADGREAEWCAAMARLIRKQSPTYFRWHDSGDIFSDRYLLMILVVIRLTPDTDHWIPTKELRRLHRIFVRQGFAVPRNAVFRVSAPMLGAGMTVPEALHARGVRSSSAGWDGSAGQCSAYTREGFCGDCRDCWDGSTANVNYPIH